MDITATPRKDSLTRCAEVPAEPWIVEIHGPCMGLAEGTKLAVWPGGPWRIGDVVALRTARGYLVHRLLGRAGSGRRSRWLHGGDRGDGLGVVSESEILGRVRIELPQVLPRRVGPLLLALRARLWWEEFAGAAPGPLRRLGVRAWRRLPGVPPNATKFGPSPLPRGDLRGPPGTPQRPGSDRGADPADRPAGPRRA